MSQELQEQLQLGLEHTLYESQTPGAAVAVHINGQPFLETCVGYQDLEHKVSLPTDANFYIYSITKSLLATASLHLASEGLLDLDTSVQLYLPHFPLDTSVTLRQLLSHTGGLPNYGGTSAYVDAVRMNPDSPWSREAFLDLAQTQNLQFTPGRGWNYSNIGYLLVRCVLEEVTGLSMQECLHKLIFKPLSLQKTFVPNTLCDVHELTPGYSHFFNRDKLQDVTRFYHPGWVAHGVVVSTAPELAKLMDAIFVGKLLDGFLVEQMLRPAYPLGKHHLFRLLEYGMGLFVGVDSPYGIVGGHVGEGPGYSVAAFHFSSLARCRVTLVALANQDRHELGLQLVFNMVHTLERLADFLQNHRLE